jgi:hypothetical protein
MTRYQTKLFCTLLFSLFTFQYTTTLAKNALATVPFELHGEHIFIQVQLNHSAPLNFIFDTGASATVLNQKEAKGLKLSSDGFTYVRTGKGPSLAYYSENNELSLHELVVTDVRVTQISLDHLERVMERRVDGIIGHDLLDQFVVMVNYDKYALEFYDPGVFQAPGNFTTHRIELISGRPYIDAALTLSNGEILEGRFQLDNGSGSSITVYSPFVDEHNLFNKVGTTNLIYTMSFAGITDKNYAGRLQRLDVGNYQLTNIPIRLNRSRYKKRAFKDGIGHIGNEVLKRFNIAFDYSRGISYWYPNSSFVEEFKEAYSGLVVKSNRKDPRVYVKHVFENSPAFHAGLAKDDEIVMINNIKTEGRSSHEVNDLLNRSARDIEIVIRRNNEVKKLSLHPRSL